MFVDRCVFFGHCIAFPFYILAIVLLTRRFTESDYPYVISKLILCIQNLSYSFYFFLLHMLYCLSILCCFVLFVFFVFAFAEFLPLPELSFLSLASTFVNVADYSLNIEKKTKLIRTKIFSLPGRYWISTNSNHAL